MPNSDIVNTTDLNLCLALKTILAEIIFFRKSTCVSHISHNLKKLHYDKYLGWQDWVLILGLQNNSLQRSYLSEG